MANSNIVDIAKEKGFYPAGTESKKSTDDVLNELATLSSIEYDKVRKAKAKELGIKVSTLDAEVSALQPKGTQSYNTNETDLKQSAMSIEIAEKFNNTACYDITTKQWHYRHGDIYKAGHEEDMQALVMAELDEIKQDGYAISWITAITSFLKLRLKTNGFETDRHLLPVLNGVINLKTKELEEYDDRLFNWQLPYAYDPSAKCPTVEDYLFMATEGDAYKIAFLKAWLYLVLTGRYDLQKYLEAVGSGGTGKSTFQDLCTMLVGEENRVVTDLKRLEKSQFETANLKGKRLALVTDSGKYAGEVSNLKAIVGSDPLPYEKKGIQAAEPFVFTGLVMVAANESVQSSDYTSGLSRRKIPIEFNVRVTEADKQKYRHKGGIVEAMRNEMPGLLNMLLAMDENEVINLINNPQGSMLREKIETEISTNPILGWIEENLIECSAGEEVNFIGDHSNHPDLYFYPNYVDWCNRTGRVPGKVDGFSKLILDNCGSYGIETAKLSKQRRKNAPPETNQGTVLKGLRLRLKNIDDDLPGLITKSLPCDNPVTTSVTTQTRSSDRCDRCDNLSTHVTFAEEMEVAL